MLSLMFLYIIILYQIEIEEAKFSPQEILPPNSKDNVATLSRSITTFSPPSSRFEFLFPLFFLFIFRSLGFFSSIRPQHFMIRFDSSMNCRYSYYHSLLCIFSYWIGSFTEISFDCLSWTLKITTLDSILEQLGLLN